MPHLQQGSCLVEVVASLFRYFYGSLLLYRDGLWSPFESIRKEIKCLDDPLLDLLDENCSGGSFKEIPFVFEWYA